MKTLSVKNPWAMWICSGIKDVENRTWKTNFRGRVLIHASTKMDNIGQIVDEYLDDNMYYDVQCIQEKLKELAYNYKIKETNGAIIGSVEIIDCVINYNSPWAEQTPMSTLGDYELPTNDKVIYNWVLKNPELFTIPIFNVKGKLNLWEYDGDFPEGLQSIVMTKK